MEEPLKHNSLKEALKSWLAELLDLTGRNQLLYLKNYKSQIELNSLEFFDFDKFIKEVEGKLVNSEIEVAVEDYFVEPQNNELVTDEEEVTEEEVTEEEVTEEEVTEENTRITELINRLKEDNE